MEERSHTHTKVAIINAMTIQNGLVWLTDAATESYNTFDFDNAHCLQFYIEGERRIPLHGTVF